MKIVLWVLGIILGLTLVAFIAFQVSPKPSAMLIARAFNGEVKISSININNKLFHKFLFLNSSNDYNYDGKTFLMLSSKENKEFVNTNNFKNLGTPSRMEKCNGLIG